MPAQEYTSAIELDKITDKVIALDFWAEWAKPCTQMNTLFDQLAENYTGIQFFKIDAEKFSELTEKYEVSVVPCFLFLRNGKILDKIDGANGPELASKASFFSQVTPKTHNEENHNHSHENQVKEDINTRLPKLINSSPVMLFMKGTPDHPQCGFSSKIVAILKKENVQFGSFNILSDEEVRQGLKTYSNWPTYPQLYAKGKLIGGLDIVKELQEEGELQATLQV